MILFTIRITIYFFNIFNIFVYLNGMYIIYFSQCLDFLDVIFFFLWYALAHLTSCYILLSLSLSITLLLPKNYYSSRCLRYEAINSHLIFSVPENHRIYFVFGSNFGDHMNDGLLQKYTHIINRLLLGVWTLYVLFFSFMVMIGMELSRYFSILYSPQ